MTRTRLFVVGCLLVLPVSLELARAQVNIKSSFQTLAGGIDVVSGHVKASGAPPVVSACGATPSIVGSDTAGKVTVGTGTITSCTLTFAAAFSPAPACTIGSSVVSGVMLTTTTTALVLTHALDMSTSVVNYHCIEGS